MTGVLTPRHDPVVDATPQPDSPSRRARAPRDASNEATVPGNRASRGATAEPARPGTSRARVVRVLVGLGALALIAAILTAGTWGPRALSRLAFFRVRRVEIEGAQYASPSDVASRLAIDTAVSVWTDLDALARRVAAHPLLDGARVERRLPGVLRVVVHERVPVALVPNGPRGALVVYDADGIALPLAPARVGGIDAPLAGSADPALLRALGALRHDAPRVYARVLEVARVPRAALGAAVGATPSARSRAARSAAPVTPERDELDFILAPLNTRLPDHVAPARSTLAAAPAPGPVLVRTAVGVAAARFADLTPVEDDLARRGVRAVELDLRFRDQVVARLP